MTLLNPISAPEHFRTSRLTCRAVSPDDAEVYGGLFSQPALLAHRPDPTPLAREATDAMLADDLDHWRRFGFGRWALVHAGHVVGLGGLTLKHGFTGLNLSYHLSPDMWGQGLASEFVRGVLDHARAILPDEEVYGLVRPSNMPSIRVLEKAGFAILRELDMGGASMLELRLKIR